MSDVPLRRKEDQLTTRHEDRMDTIKVIASVVVAVIVVAAVLSTAIVSVGNRMLGDSNRGLLQTYATEQTNLAAAGVEQGQFALYLIQVASANCANQALIEAKLGITDGVACPVLPHFDPLPGTTTTKPKK